MADIAINFSDAKMPRVLAAMGKYLNTTDENGVQIDATAVQIAAHFKDEIKRIVGNIERREAEAAIQVPEL
jgi:hypothetical protein